MQKTYTSVFNVPILQAFTSVNDEKKIAVWMHGRMHTEFLTPNNPANPVGVKFIQTVQEIIKIEGEVVDFKAPFLLGVKFHVGILEGRVFYWFKETGPTSTELTFDLHLFDDTEEKKHMVDEIFPLFEALVNGLTEGLQKLAEERK